MKSKAKILIGIIIVILIAVVVIVINIKKNNTIKSLNEILSDEKVQNELLTDIIEDCVKDLNLGKNGEYRLKVQSDSILNLLTKELLLDQSFVQEVEVESNSPDEVYMLKYDYNESTMQLAIIVNGMYSDLDTKINTYQLYSKDNDVEYKKIDEKVVPQKDVVDNGDKEESVVYVTEQ